MNKAARYRLTNGSIGSSKAVDLQRLVRLLNAITEALREMDKCPDDCVQDIWNESLKSWQTGLRMDHNLNIEPNDQGEARPPAKRL